MTDPPAGWYPNPEGDGQRYWDGETWTEHFAPPPARQRSQNPGIAGAIGVAMAIAGSLGPWEDLGFVSSSGIRGDGLITLIAALLAGVAVALSEYRGQRFGRRAAYTSAAFGVIILVVAAYDLIHLGELAGWGEWAAAAGGGTLIVAGGLMADNAPTGR